MAKEDWEKSLELLTRILPDDFVNQLDIVCPKLWEKGEYQQVYDLLRTLPPKYRENPRVLRWIIWAALELGEHTKWLAQLEQALQHGPPPELRSLAMEVFFYSGNYERGFREAKLAVEQSENPYTLYQYGQGLQLYEPVAAIDQLKKALRLAEQQFDGYWTTMAALALAQTYSQIGEYAAAVSWAEQGIKQYQAQHLGHNLLRLKLINEEAFSRLLTGDTVGLEERLRRESEHLGEVAPGLSRLLRSTLGELLIAEGRGNEAQLVFTSIWNELYRREAYNRYSDGYVRALLESGELESAHEVASNTLSLTQDLPIEYSRSTRLAMAMVSSIRMPSEGIRQLERCLTELRGHVTYQHSRAVLYLLRALEETGEHEKMQYVLEANEAELKALGMSGLRLLGGPEDSFQGVYALLQGQTKTLEMYFLGQANIQRHNRQLRLRQRLADFLAVFAMFPDGISLPRLAVEVYGDSANHNTTKGQVAHLRKQVAIKAHPYKFAEPFWADFIELKRLIQTGRVRESVQLYKGSLLPQSNAKIVEEERWVLEEALKSLVLQSGDVESIWALAQLIRDDPQLWDKASQIIPIGDPRKVLARAFLRRLIA